MASVRPATLDDVVLLARVAAEGFADDPVMRWVVPDDARRLGLLTVMFTGLVHDVLPDRGTVHLADDASVALWRDPSFEHGRTAADRVHDAAGPEEEGASPFTADELVRLVVLGAAMVASHPHEPHWYLNVVSTLPTHRGRGLGAAVLQPVLGRCDANGTRAYLESTNPRNLTLYRRQGFVDAGEIVLPDGPHLTRMWREPAAG